MTNTTLNEQNIAQDDVKNMSDQELQDKMKIAQESSNLDNILLYGTEMKRRMTPEVNEFEKQQKEMEEKIKTGEMGKEDMQKYFLEDIKKFQAKVDARIDETNKYKDKRITELENQLESSITDLPGLGEYFSLERRRLVKLSKKIKEFKADKANYPKNLLIYCMAMIKTKVFGTREAIKRGWTKMLWRRKNDDIKEELKIMDEKLAPVAGESKSRELLKNILRKEVTEAKKTYVDGIAASVGVESIATTTATTAAIGV